eukprot:COSAG06_NODE_23790_length_681_cov_1.238832_1_plen_69_part_00
MRKRWRKTVIPGFLVPHHAGVGGALAGEDVRSLGLLDLRAAANNNFVVAVLHLDRDDLAAAHHALQTK